MVILKADKVRARAAVVEASPPVLRVRVHAVLVNQVAVTNLDPRVLRVQGDPLVRAGVVRKALVRKQVRMLRQVGNSCRVLAQSKAVSIISIANLAKVAHVAPGARAARVSPAAQAAPAAQVAHVPQVSQAVRVAHLNKVVHGVRALVLASQKVEINLDQAIQALGRCRKVMIGNRAGPLRMSPDWGLLSLRVVVASALNVFRG